MCLENKESDIRYMSWSTYISAFRVTFFILSSIRDKVEIQIHSPPPSIRREGREFHQKEIATDAEESWCKIGYDVSLTFISAKGNRHIVLLDGASFPEKN